MDRSRDRERLRMKIGGETGGVGDVKPRCKEGGREASSGSS